MMNCAIFDMDGVLLDSEPLHMKTYIDYLSQFSVRIDEKYMQKLVGLNNKGCFEILKNDFDNLTLTSEEFNSGYSKLLLEYFKKAEFIPSDGIVKLLGLLKDNDFKIGLASSSSLTLIDIILGKLGIKKFFDCITSGEEVAFSKPAPDIFLLAADRLKVKPSDAFIVEDSKSGCNAAKSANIKAIGYINKTTGKQDLSSAAFRISSFNEINSDLSFLKRFEELEA